MENSNVWTSPAQINPQNEVEGKQAHSKETLT
jgi:hypothetical protein